jgi:O-antigen/teichoic acid export membrane protein
MNATELSAIAGVILSLAFSYLPGLSGWFDEKNPTEKRLLMAVVLLVATAAIFGLSCAGVLTVASCNQPGALGLVSALIAALVANQATYTISPKG